MAWSAATRRTTEPVGGPTRTVVPVPPTPSQIVQTDSLIGSGWESNCGAPGVPSSGPRLTRANSDSRTGCGLVSVAATNRADARLSTGCQVSPTRTYSAPDA